MQHKIFAPFLVAAALFTACGCSEPPPPPTPASSTPRASASAAVSPLEQGTLPDRVENLTVTPLPVSADAIDKALQKPGPEKGGAFVVLLCPTAPDKGVLVWGGPASSVASLAGKKGDRTNVTGVVKSFTDAKVAEAVKASTGVNLATRDGKLQYIVPDSDPWADKKPAPSGTPAAGTPGPGASATPAASDTPLIELSPDVEKPTPVAQ